MSFADEWLDSSKFWSRQRVMTSIKMRVCGSRAIASDLFNLKYAASWRSRSCIEFSFHKFRGSLKHTFQKFSHCFWSDPQALQNISLQALHIPLACSTNCLVCPGKSAIPVIRGAAYAISANQHRLKGFCHNQGILEIPPWTGLQFVYTSCHLHLPGSRKSLHPTFPVESQTALFWSPPNYPRRHLDLQQADTSLLQGSAFSNSGEEW